MRSLVKILASVILFSLPIAFPAPAEDFKLGIGGGATFPIGDYADAYKTGWTTTIRGLWLPSSSVVGLRAAGYYGQNSSKSPDFFGATIKSSSLWGLDANAAFRLTGKGAEGLYANAGIGFRGLTQGVEYAGIKESQTDVNISYNAGLGYSKGWFFTEANVVYFRVMGADLWSIPVTVGFQF
jgi:hypothetical protein